MKVGLALGSGSARGFSHIGIIEVFQEKGIPIDVVAGTSIGAIVGASFAAGNLKKMHREAMNINRLNWTGFFNPSFSLDGWINKERMQLFLVRSGVYRKKLIEDLDIPFGTVTCDMATGKEVWCTKGSLFDAVWPSMAMPGVFPPVASGDGRWLIDGGIVNPVPVSLCRALGADFVIAVNLNADILRNRTEEIQQHTKHKERKPKDILLERFYSKAKNMLPFNKKEEVEFEPPDFFDTVSQSINIAQDRITKTRLAGDPPEIILAPKLSHVGLLETYRAKETIEEGRRTALVALPYIEDMLANHS